MIVNEVETIKFLKGKIGRDPQLAVVLGSGLNGVINNLKSPIIIPYSEIPSFPLSTAPGHEGKLIIAEIKGQSVLFMQGRFHYYEGYDMEQIIFPIRVFSSLGIDNIVITNAAGAVNKDFTPGDLVIIDDHINFAGINPLIGKNRDDYGPRFNDMTRVYSKILKEKALKVARKHKIDIKKGVYAYLTGPSFETPAEVRALRVLGADMAGMSTVPEVTCASHCSMSVLGISFISNMAAGILENPISGEEVIEIGKKSEKKLAVFFNDLLEDILS